jgi:MFS family permease
MHDKEISLLSPLFFRLIIPFGLGYFVSVFLGSANAIMSPILVDTFSLSPADLGFMTSVYLISFGLAQFPLGVLLDRYGARRTLAPSLLLAVLGTLVFAKSNNFSHLVISRSLQGIGLSCALMAAFKAYSEYLMPEKIPIVYSMQCLIGGIGGMFATRPISLILKVISWRELFVGIAFLAFLVSMSVWFLPPHEHNYKNKNKASFSSQFQTMLKFIKDPRFWRIAPIVITGDSIMFAYLYLWIGPWMKDVALLNSDSVSKYMMYTFTGAAFGYFTNGALLNYLQRKNFASGEKLYLISGILLSVFLSLIAFLNPAISMYLWPFVMFLSTMTMISFSLINRYFAVTEVGRVMCLLNFMIFFMSFLMQWFIGLVLNKYPVINGHFSSIGYKESLVYIIILNVVADIYVYIKLLQSINNQECKQ